MSKRTFIAVPNPTHGRDVEFERQVRKIVSSHFEGEESVGELIIGEQNYGRGADWPVVEIMLLLYLVKDFNEHIDAWISLGQKIRLLVEKLEDNFSRCFVDENVALLIAIDHVASRQEISTIEIVSEDIVPKHAPFDDPNAESFRDRTGAIYVFIFRTGNETHHLIGIDSQNGSVVLDRRI